MKTLKYVDYVLYTILLLVPLMGCANQDTRTIPGPTGATGAQGAAGPQGVQGQAGQNGADGTVIYSVQFCPGYLATQYPEIGLCISGKLYAEFYNPPSSGLVYLPDGAYISTETTAPCTFNVVGCVVTP